jgi:Reverse transcriptase (RNA-dependent DNA polymerase)
VPQGSILGPLLFLIYINDIVNCSKILKFILFADDTNLFHSHKDAFELMKSINIELSKLSDWFRANKLSLNVKKTNYILFGKKRLPNFDQNFELIIDGNRLERVQSTKFLGVYIDEKLNWIAHTNHVSLSISKALGILYRIRNVLPNKVLLILYHTMIYPYLSYCNIIWGGANLSILKKVIVLQKRAIRLVTRSSYRAPTGPLFRRLRLLRLEDIHKLQTALFMFKFKYCILPLSCMNYFSVNLIHSHFTRHICYFNLASFRTSIRERCITVRGPRLWDSLPIALQNCSSIHMLKTELTNNIISVY